MKITIVNWDARTESIDAQLEALAAHVVNSASEVVLLPEMPFSVWLAASETYDEERWQASVALHLRMLARLGGRTSAVIAGSRPVIEAAGERHNRTFLWRNDGFLAQPHDKQDLPLESGYWEAAWYSPGPRCAATAGFGGTVFGFLVCTELWNRSRAMTLGQQGAHVLLAPRATPDLGSDVWLAGIRSAAVVSGCYVLSSNFAYPLQEGFTFEGLSAACDPDGTILALCDAHNPFRTVDIDISAAEAAKQTYPRYIFRGR